MILAISGSQRRDPCSQEMVSFCPNMLSLSLSHIGLDGNSNIPACPNCVDVHPLGDIHDQLHVGVVVVVGASRHFNVVVCHSDVVCVGLQILGGGHDGELDGALVAECLVRPFSNRSDFLDGSNAVVGNQNLVGAPQSASHTF